MQRRIILIGICSTLFIALVIGKLFYYQILQTGSLSALVNNEVSRTLVLPATRGYIYDRQGRVLAMDTPGAVVFADPRKVQKVGAEAATLAKILGLGTGEVTKALSTKGSFDYLDRFATAAQGQAVTKAKLAGIYVTKTTRREYPMGGVAGPVLGFLGVDGKPLGGVELSYQKYLMGEAGEEIGQFDAAGNFLTQFPHRTITPVPGDGLVLTLDSVIQVYAQRALDQAMAKYHAQKGLVLVMDPQSGAILALAVDPTFDPNQFYKYPASILGDLAVTSSFPPGSTFKPLVATAALATKTITPQTTFYDPGYLMVDGIRIDNWTTANSWSNLDQAIQMSDDVYFMNVGLKLGVTNLIHYIQLFGINAPTGVDLPGEGQGIVPSAGTVRPVDLATMAFGQTLTTTPLELLTAICAVAEGGNLPWPHVGQAVLAPDGNTLLEIKPRVVRRVAPSAVEDRVVQAMLGVISPQGTGALAQVPGYVLAGKSGTSQLVVNGKVSVNHFMASFVGFGPIPSPSLAVLVQIINPDPKIGFYGGDLAGPVFAQVMEESLRYLRIPAKGNMATPATSSVAKGVVVPVVAGEDAVMAGSDVAKVGLSPDVVGTGRNVLHQYPIPGKVEKLGGTVVLLTAPPVQGTKVVLPALEGLDQRETADLLTELGLVLAPSGSGFALSQDPAAGASLSQGAVVKVTFVPGVP